MNAEQARALSEASQTGYSLQHNEEYQRVQDAIARSARVGMMRSQCPVHDVSVASSVIDRLREEGFDAYTFHELDAGPKYGIKWDA